MPTPAPVSNEMPETDKFPTPPIDEKPDNSNEMPFEKKPFDAGVETDEDSNPKKFIQQLSGKLGQSLRKYSEEQGQPDFELEKFAVNSVLSATHTGEMDEKDQKDIIKKVKKSGKGASSEEPSEEPSEEFNEKPSESSDEELDENLFVHTPKKLSIFAPEGSEEAKYNENFKNQFMEKESNNYMFWQNLKTLQEAVNELLNMDYDKVDSLLSDGHGWALDHVATSTDDIEEVYHFVKNNIGGYGYNDLYGEYEEHDDWANPMEMTTQNVNISDDLNYHLENNIPLNETIYRMGSEKYFNLIKEVKKLHEKGLIKLNENDAFIVNEFDNQYAVINGEKIKMNFIYEEVENKEINEAEYKGKKVELGKPKRGGSKKFYVYVKNPKTGKVKKVSFGAKAGGGNLAVKLRDPKARKAFADRHNCEQKNDKTTPGYWSCRLPRYSKSLGLSGGGTWW